MGTRPETLGGPALLGVVTWRLTVAATAGQSSSQCLFFIHLFISKSWVPSGALYSHVAGSDLFPGAGHLLEAILREGRDHVSRTLPVRTRQSHKLSKRQTTVVFGLNQGMSGRGQETGGELSCEG